MSNFADAMKESIPSELLLEIMPAMRAMIEHEVIFKILRAEQLRLVENRMDVNNEEILIREIREMRQTTKVLTQFHESLKLFLKEN